MTVWRPNLLTSEQLEERRLEAARRLRDGDISQAEIARDLGVSEAAVHYWSRRLRDGGPEALSRRAHTGRRPRLSEDDWQVLLGILADGACAHGFETERWTLSRIAAVIRSEFGVQYHPRHLARPLRARGWTPQRPASQALERDDDLILAWLKRDWPRIKKKLGGTGRKWPSWMNWATASKRGPVPPGLPKEKHRSFDA